MLKKILVFIFTTSALIAEIPYSLEHLLNYQQPHREFRVNGFEEAMEWKRDPTPLEFYDQDVLRAKKIFTRFCDNLKEPAKSSIPSIIHLIWIGSEIPEKVSACFNTWKKHHPGWEVKIWQDRDILTFEWSCEHSKICFEKAETWAEKTDVFRLELLYKFGGIYSDADVVCLNSFEDIVNHDVQFFSCFELNYIGKHYGEPFFVGSAVIGSSSKSSVIKYCIDYLRSKEEAPLDGVIKRTGPGLISRACHAVLANNSENILILPCSYLYPLPWKKRETTSIDVLDYISPDALAIHLWDGSWCEHERKK